MARHQVSFSPSGRISLVEDGTSILDAALQVGEPIATECGGRGACGRCLVAILGGTIPDYCREGEEGGAPLVLSCQTPVQGPLTVRSSDEAEPPPLPARGEHTGADALANLSPWPLVLDPIVAASAGDLGVAVDVGTTTLQLLLLDLATGVVLAEAGAYNPQIPRGADVISRIVAAEKGLLAELAASVRAAVATMVTDAGARAAAPLDPRQLAERIRAYVVAGNLTMVHLLLARDPAGIRRVPSEPQALAFDPVPAADLGWPGGRAPVHTIPAVGGWVGGDIVAGLVRAGFPRAADGLSLYVDLGTNGEVALGGADFALACACSAGPAFEGGGIRCGMRADAGAVDGARIDLERGALDLSTIGAGPARGICGSGLISLADALFRAGWIDRTGRLTERLPPPLRVEGDWGRGVSLGAGVTLWERDLASLIRAKGAVFSGIRSLHGSLGEGAGAIERVVVSGNFGRFLNLPAAVGIGLLPDLPPGTSATCATARSRARRSRSSPAASGTSSPPTRRASPTWTSRSCRATWTSSWAPASCRTPRRSCCVWDARRPPAGPELPSGHPAARADLGVDEVRVRHVQQPRDPADHVLLELVLLRVGEAHQPEQLHHPLLLLGVESLVHQVGHLVERRRLARLALGHRQEVVRLRGREGEGALERGVHDRALLVGDLAVGPRDLQQQAGGRQPQRVLARLGRVFARGCDHPAFEKALDAVEQGHLPFRLSRSGPGRQGARRVTRASQTSFSRISIVCSSGAPAATLTRRLRTGRPSFSAARWATASRDSQGGDPISR